MTALGRVPEYVELERVHDECMERYINLVELQSRLFKKGYAQAGRDLDGQIRLARAARERALNALLNHPTDVQGDD